MELDVSASKKCRKHHTRYHVTSVIKGKANNRTNKSQLEEYPHHSSSTHPPRIMTSRGNQKGTKTTIMNVSGWQKGHLTQIEIMSRIGVKRQTGEVYQPSPSSHQTVGIICLNRGIMSPGPGRSGGNQVRAYTKHQRRATRAREVVGVWLLNPFPLALFRSY